MYTFLRSTIFRVFVLLSRSPLPLCQRLARPKRSRITQCRRLLGRNFTSHFRFSGVGQNLLQPHHAEFGMEPGPLVQIERSAYAQITWQK